MSLKRWADEVVKPAAPVALPRLAFINGHAPLDDSKELAVELAAKFNEARIVKAGADAWQTVTKAESFDGWVKIGKALAVGRNHALTVSGAATPIGQNYSKAFGQWLAECGFKDMSKQLRSWALTLHEHVAAITTWRETLTDKQRKRLRNPQAIVVRWRRSTVPAQANGSNDVAKAAAAHWQKFVVCVQAMPADQAAPFLAQAAAFLDDYAWPF